MTRRGLAHQAHRVFGDDWSPMKGRPSPFGLGRRRYAANNNEPKLVADFKRNEFRKNGRRTTFDNLFSFTRASTSGMFLNSAGVLQTAASGVPRLNAYRYVGGKLVPQGLLFESTAGTNLHPESRDLDEWNGAVTNLTVTPDADIAPDGTTTATRLTTAVTGGTSHLIRHTMTKAAASTDYVWSIFAKDDGFGFAASYLHGASTSNRVEVYANLSTGETSAAAFGSGFTLYDSGAELFPDGWVRYWVSFQSNADTDIGVQHYVAEGLGDRTVHGDGVSGILSWGADLKAGRVLSSHVPTDGSTATRAAELISIAAADLPYSAAAMSVAMEGGASYTDTGSTTETRWVLWQLDASNFIQHKLNTAGSLTGRHDALQEAAGTFDTAVGSSELVVGEFVPFSWAARHGAAFIQMANDGTAGSENSTPTALPDLSASDFDIADFSFVGTIGLFRMWDADIAQAGIEEASA